MGNESKNEDFTASGEPRCEYRLLDELRCLLPKGHQGNHHMMSLGGSLESKPSRDTSAAVSTPGSS